MAKEKMLSDRVADSIYEMIKTENKFKMGDKLPNELELSQQLSVSRATLREAIHTLTTQGVLEVRRGRGTFVSMQVDQVEDYGFSSLERVRTQLRDLFELRSIVEPQAARLACQRATAEELEEILCQGARVERCIKAGQDRTEADRAFHAAIVRAAHNEFMVRLLPMISQAVETAIDTGEDQEKLAEITLRDHALLLEFFQKRDAEGAEHAMAIHMHHAMDEMGLD